MEIGLWWDKNVISAFSYRKIIPYSKDEETITGMKIISMDTDSLKKIIEKELNISISMKYLISIMKCH